MAERVPSCVVDVEPALAPSLDVSATEAGIHIDAELPGVRDDAVQVDLSGDRSTIHGEKPEEHAGARRQLTERSFGAFRRSIRLPFAPRPEEVEVTLERGVLRVVLPKPAGQAAHRIPVRAGGSAVGGSPAARGCFGGNAALARHPTEDTARCGTADLLQESS